jgi:large subunit ribosomal protein L24e
MIKSDGKVFTFLNARCERFHQMKKNPRNTTWTVLYRRKHKKGQEFETETKKKTRRTTKFQRSIVGASLTEILAKRNMKPEVRKAQREQAIRAAKEKARVTKAAKQKPLPVQAPAKGSKVAKAGGKAPKPVAPKAPRVGGKR